MSAGGPGAGRDWRPGTAGLAVAALAAIAMAASLGNGFTYDDRFIVLDNARVHGLDGWWRLFAQSYWPPPALGALYRPATMLAFAAEWTVGRGAPWVFHLGNVAAFAGLAWGVWRLAARCLPAGAALAVGVAFAAHPVHVEAVANVVGLSELLMALGTVAAVLAWLRLRERGPGAVGVAAVAAATAVAALAKEQGLLVPAVLVLAEALLVRDARGWRGRLARAAVPLAAAVAVVAVVLVLRGRAVETWQDAPAGLWMVITDEARRWTMLGVAAEWARLLLWPMRQAIEYSPPHVDVHAGWSLALLPGAVVVGGATALAVASVRRIPAATFGLALAAVALAPVANLAFPSGVILAERTLLLPSVGVLLALGAWGAAIWEESAPTARAAARPVVVAAVVALAALGTWRCLDRAPMWRDDSALLARATAETPRSYRPWYLAGQLALRRGDTAAAIPALRRSIALFPDDFGALTLLGDTHRKRDECGAALPLLDRAVRIYPPDPDARVAFVACLLGTRRFDAARAAAADGVRLGREIPAFRRLLTLADTLERLAGPGRPSAPGGGVPRPLAPPTPSGRR